MPSSYYVKGCYKSPILKLSASKKHKVRAESFYSMNKRALPYYAAAKSVLLI